MARESGEQIIVFGEDDNDRKSIKILLCGLRPDITPGSVKPLREPIALVKDIAPDRLRKRTERVHAALRAANVRQRIRSVLLHEDVDDFEPQHEKAARRIEDAYRTLPWPVYAVVPAWELEAWWFLFPAAVAALHPSWQPLDGYRGRHLGKIRNAKEELVRALRPAGKRSAREYAESDSATIAQKIVELGLLREPWFARSDSWLLFVEVAKQV